MSNVNAIKTPVLADSVALVVAAFQGKNYSEQEALAAVNGFIMNEELFSKNQRPAGLQQINVKLGTRFTMNLVKKAIKSVPANPIHVDGLGGTANLFSNNSANQPGDTNALTELNLESDMKDGKPATLKNIRDEAAERFGANPVEMSLETFNGYLNSAGITAENIPGFAITLKLKNETLQFVETESFTESMYNWVNASNANTVAFINAIGASVETIGKTPTGNASAAIPNIPTGNLGEPSDNAQTTAKPEATFVEKVTKTIRGNRETGFSSGAVAVAAAVIGGAGEMVMRGSVTIGSAVGLAAGAVGSYFAAEALEGTMKSETGRYIVAGSVGLAAGGLAARLGRVGQTALFGGAEAEVSAEAAPVLGGEAAAIPSLAGMI